MWIPGNTWKMLFLYLMPKKLQTGSLKHGRVPFDLESRQGWVTIPLVPLEALAWSIWFYSKLTDSEFASDQFAMLTICQSFPNDFRIRNIIWGKALINFITWEKSYSSLSESNHLTATPLPPLKKTSLTYSYPRLCPLKLPSLTRR